jgi:hypothetical protein
MAPKKEKVEKVSAGAQEDMVFEYLRKQKYESMNDFSLCPCRDEIADMCCAVVVHTP